MKKKNVSPFIEAFICLLFIYTFLIYMWIYSPDAKEINNICFSLSENEYMGDRKNAETYRMSTLSIPYPTYKASETAERFYESILSSYAANPGNTSIAFPSFSTGNIESSVLKGYIETLNRRSKLLSDAVSNESYKNEENREKTAIYVRTAGSEALNYIFNMKCLFFLSFITPFIETFYILNLKETSLQ